MLDGLELIPEKQRRLVKQLREAVLSDTSGLARDDHDAIELRIDQLEQFIGLRYLERSGKIEQ